MATLSDFRRNTKAIQDGVWVRVNQAVYGDLEIRSRGFTDDFIDAQTIAYARAAEVYGGDRNLVPNAEMRTINAFLLREYLVLEVRNLTDDNGEVVPLEEFLQMLGDPAYAMLSQAAFQAAGRVTRQSEAQVKAAEGNSLPASALH